MGLMTTVHVWMSKCIIHHKHTSNEAVKRQQISFGIKEYIYGMYTSDGMGYYIGERVVSGIMLQELPVSVYIYIYNKTNHILARDDGI